MNDATNKKIPDARILYEDIIDLPHHRSSVHPPMSLYDRAAQFAPFAALTGYNEMISEEARLTEMRKAQNQTLLNAKLSLIDKAVREGAHPRLGFTVFVPDERKEGGEYIDLSGTVKRVDLFSRTLVLYAENEKTDGITLEMENIQDIYGSFVDRLNDDTLNDSYSSFDSSQAIT